MIVIDCANTIGNGGAQAPSTDCNMACTGAPSEICGAGCEYIYLLDLLVPALWPHSDFPPAFRSTELVHEWRPTPLRSDKPCEGGRLDVIGLLQVGSVACSPLVGLALTGFLQRHNRRSYLNRRRQPCWRCEYRKLHPGMWSCRVQYRGYGVRG